MLTTPPTMLQTALKEWQVAIDALAQGETILLLRKGGIREVGGRFQVAHDRVLLYPTYEHQQPHGLKPLYASQVKPVASGWHPETVRLEAWATITEAQQVSDLARLQALSPFHIWQEAFITERFRWKPSQPLFLLLLRVYRLNSPQILPYHDRYGGCKSWLELDTALSLAESVPVLDDRTYADRVRQIHTVL